MEKHEQVRAILLELYEDGEVHNLAEAKQRCQAAGIDVRADRNIVSNVISRMRKLGYLNKGTEKGNYWLTEEGKAKAAGISWMEHGEKKLMMQERRIGEKGEKYFLLKPQGPRRKEMRLSILERGEIRLNAMLRKEIDSRKIRISLSRDYRMILLEPDAEGKDAHVFTKAGTAKNTEIVELLRKARLEFPIVYKVTRSGSVEAWEGRIQVSSKK